MAWGDYTAQPKANSSADFVINKNLNLPSNYKKKGLVAAETDAFISTADSPSNNDRFTVNVPAVAGGTGVTITIRIVFGTPSAGTANEIQIAVGGNDNSTADRIRAAINGDSNTAIYQYGAGSGDSTNGLAGITAAVGSSGLPNVKITADQVGANGNDIVFTDVQGTIVADGSTEASPAVVGTGAAGVLGSDISAFPSFLNTPGPATLRNRSTPYKVTK